MPSEHLLAVKSDEIQELMEQIQKEFEDRVSIQEFLKYVERQEALNQGMLKTIPKTKSETHYRR